MSRFTLVRGVKIEAANGEEYTYDVIANKHTFSTIDAPFGRVKVGSGFIRCRGKQYIATYGRETPIYAGREDEIYYAPMSFFDGDWSMSGPNKRGLHTHVTASSGEGRLFSDLEAFCQANAVEAKH